MLLKIQGSHSDDKLLVFVIYLVFIRVENTGADQRCSLFINKQLNTSLNGAACVRTKRKQISLIKDIIKAFSDVLAHPCRVSRALAYC